MTVVDVLEVSLHLAARPETVFPYFTDPARYTKWMGTQATLEPVPGGTYRVSMRDGVEASGEFVEVDPPHRLVFTCGWNHDHAVAPGSTRVVVTLVAEDGGTRVVLRHYNLPDDEQRGSPPQRLGDVPGLLSVLMSGGEPGPDPNESKTHQILGPLLLIATQPGGRRSTLIMTSELAGLRRRGEPNLIWS